MNTRKERKMEEQELSPQPQEEVPEILDEICVEELAIDGICGVY